MLYCEASGGTASGGAASGGGSNATCSEEIRQTLRDKLMKKGRDKAAVQQSNDSGIDLAAGQPIATRQSKCVCVCWVYVCVCLCVCMYMCVCIRLSLLVTLSASVSPSPPPLSLSLSLSLSRWNFQILGTYSVLPIGWS